MLGVKGLGFKVFRGYGLRFKGHELREYGVSA